MGKYLGRIDWEHFAIDWYNTLIGLSNLIKHSRFQYVKITDDGTIVLKTKPFWKWFDANRYVDAKAMPSEYRKLMGIEWEEEL